MSNEKIDATIVRIFKEKLSQLKSGEQVGMEIYFFFDDSYWFYRENRLIGREENYAIISMLIDEFKPTHYALVADTNARDPHTNAIMYEQLMACIVSPVGEHKTTFQPYDRLHNGKIKLSRPRMSTDGLQLGGIGVSLFEPAPEMIADADRKASLLGFFAKVIAAEKMPYVDIKDPAPGASKH